MAERSKSNGKVEKALGVAIDGWRASGRALEEELRELGLLAATAGAELAKIEIQQRSKPDPGTLVGKGKVDELVEMSEDYDLVIFNETLKPAQHNTLRKEFSVKVIDRSDLILDIFSQRAHTRDAKMQVELAQLQHNLPRKRGWGEALNNPGAGIGTRGPGEPKMAEKEQDIRDRIHQLEQRLEEVRQKRRTQRKNREGMPEISLVGYTNSGKTTLLNSFADSDAREEDMLFATLDTKTRRVHLEGDRYFLLTDTVGFIQRMPPKLKEAFKATLEELNRAECLLHVIDINGARLGEKMEAVAELLEELGVEDRPCFKVFNKKDLAPEGLIKRYRKKFPDAYFVSAKTGEGLTELKESIYRYLLDRGRLERPDYAKDFSLKEMISQ